MQTLAKFQRLLASDARTIIGLMSGMSMDGVDLALAKCSGEYPNYEVELLGSSYRPYSLELKARLKRARLADAEEISVLNILIAKEFAACVNDFLAMSKMLPDQVDAIGSHGQTIFHATAKESEVPSTLQVGAPSLIAEMTGITTVGNFRLRDIAAGGHGAPLVAFADYVLHRHESKPTGLLNLGSIANITILTEDVRSILAFDLGPANMPIDYLASRLTPGGIDENGAISEQGKIIEPLLAAFLQIPYFSQKPPKAAGYSEFGPEVLERICKQYFNNSLPDLLRTAVEFSAQSLTDGIKRHVLPYYADLKLIKVSGGGIYNKTAMRRIGELLPGIKIEAMADRFADAKEALAFAVLAHATLSGMPNNVPHSTGASHAVVLGEIAM